MLSVCTVGLIVSADSTSGCTNKELLLWRVDVTANSKHSQRFMKYSWYFVRFRPNLQFSRKHFYESPPNTKFHGYPSSERRFSRLMRVGYGPLLVLDEVSANTVPS